MNPKKTTRLKATKGWVDAFNGHISAGWVGLSVGHYKTDARKHRVIILDARDHADQQRELRRLRRENARLAHWLQSPPYTESDRFIVSRLLESVRKGRAQ